MRGRRTRTSLALIVVFGIGVCGCMVEDADRALQSSNQPIRQAGAQLPTTKQSPRNEPPPAGAAPLKLAEPGARLRELHSDAAARYATIDSYIARLRRREQNNGTDRPEEIVLFKFRKQPFSVYFKFLGTEGKGREVVYVRGEHGNEIHTLLAAGDVPLMPAGKRMSFPVDSILVRTASRHVITDAGIGEIIERCGQLINASEQGDNRIGTSRYIGPVRRPEFSATLESIEHDIPPGHENQLPRGGKRWIMFDPESHLPVLIVTHDETGHEVEYYCYDRLEFPVKLDNADFDPERLWPAPSGRRD